MFQNNDNKGFALVLVIVTLAVLSILGVALLSRSLSETREVAYQEKKIQAHYIARAGADAVATNIIINHDRDMLDALETHVNTNISSDDNIFAEGSFDVKTKFNNGIIYIESVGEVPNNVFGTVTSTVKLELYNLQNRAIIAVGNYDLDALKALSGDVESTAGVVSGFPGPIGWVPEEGKKFNQTGRYLPPVSVPTDIDPYEDPLNSDPSPHPFDVPNNTTVTLPGSKEYSKITVGNNGVLQIDTSGGNVEIITGVLDVKGGVDVIGGNQAIFFITSSSEHSTFKTSDTGTNPVGEAAEAAEANKLFLFLDTGVFLNVSTGGRDFYGYIYGPSATVNLTSGAIVHGSITGELFNSAGNPSVYHIPLIRTPEGYEDYISGSSRYSYGIWK